MKTQEGVEIQHHAFLTSALDWVEWVRVRVGLDARLSKLYSVYILKKVTTYLNNVRIVDLIKLLTHGNSSNYKVPHCAIFPQAAVSDLEVFVNPFTC
jgi:hypothetical protein